MATSKTEPKKKKRTKASEKSTKKLANAAEKKKANAKNQDGMFEADRTESVRKRLDESVRKRLDESVRLEIIMTVTALICVLLILSYINLCGTVGLFLNRLLFGLMGVFTYLFPFVLFLFVAFYLSNRSNRIAKQKILSGLAFLFLLTGMIQLISGIHPERKLLDYYTYCSECKKGGGIFGAITAVPLTKLFGEVATAIIIAALMIVFLLLLTGKALFRLIKNRSKNHFEQRRLMKLQKEYFNAEEEYKEEENSSQREKKTAAKRMQMVDVIPLGIHNVDEKGRLLVPKEEEPLSEIDFVDSLRARALITNSRYPISNLEQLDLDVEKRAKKELAKQQKQNDKQAKKNEKLIKQSIEMEELSLASEVKEILNEPAQESYLTELERKFKGKAHTVSELSLTKQESNPSITFIKDKDFPTFSHDIEPKEETFDSFEEYDKQLDSLDKGFAEITNLEGWKNTNNSLQEEEISNQNYEIYKQELPLEMTDSNVANQKVSPIHTIKKSEESAGTKNVMSESKKLSPKEEEDQLSAMTSSMEETVKKYIFPPVSLLSLPKNKGQNKLGSETERNAELLQRTLNSFGVHVKLLNVSCGPAVTRYELQPEQGVKVSSITKLENDIKLNLAAADIRIEAPIPGKAAIGIEVPNKENSAVHVRELFESSEYINKEYGIVFAVGKDITGHNIISDIAKMPHLLIAGATGSGKSVCINTLIMSILYKYNPNDVRLIMIDPKVVELSVYNGIPHLLIPVVTDPKKAAASLNWAVMEMTNRYNKFAELHVRDLKGYNQRMEEEPYKNDPNFQKLPKIVIVVDELADLMMVAPGEVEDAIIRLSQLARAAGMHLIIATQRPSVNVITGLIKANMPSRIAFAVTSQIDSRTILDGSGAEKLLGKGDMLFYPSGYPKPIRVQGAFVTDNEVEAVVEFIKEQNTEAVYNEEVTSHINSVQSTGASSASDAMGNTNSNGCDEYFVEAGRFIIEKDKASIGTLQRIYRIGFNRAARLMDQLAEAGVVSSGDGTKPRQVLMSAEEFEQYIEENMV